MSLCCVSYFILIFSLPIQATVLVCSFPTIESAVTSTVEMLQAGVPVARVEFLDDLSLEAANKILSFIISSNAHFIY